MPVPAPNLYPPFNTIRLSHVEFGVTDLAKSRAFYVDTLGLQVTDEDADTIYLRALEERGHHCIVLQKSDKAEARDLGFKVFDEDHLDRAAAFFAAKGLPVDWVERPYLGRAFRTRDPLGIPLEFYARMDRLPPIHQQYALYKGVKPLRIDHFNCFSPDVDASVAFWNEIGFRVTEYTEDEATGRLWAAWTHRKGGVHDPQIRINAQGRAEIDLAVRAISVEEIAVVEIAVRARKRNRIGRLVDGIIVRLGQHRPPLRPSGLRRFRRPNSRHRR